MLVVTAAEDCLSFRWHASPLSCWWLGQGSVHDDPCPLTLHSLDMDEWPELMRLPPITG
jgi:hypothetical protein